MSELVIDDPYLLETAVVRPLADPGAIDRALDAATAAAAALAATPVEERVALCRRAMGVMREREQAIAADITRMMGKPRKQALREVDTMIERAEHMMAMAATSLEDTRVEGRPGYERRIQRVPLGVVFNMPAWNYPLLTCVNALVPAVLCGNAVLLKHSSRTALSGEHFAEAFEAAGASSGVVQAIHCDHRAAAGIAADRRVGYVAFTGSVAGGHAVYRAVGDGRFIDTGLELGGKDAAYVAADADLEAAAAGIVEGACYNAGQSCCGVERVYVQNEVAARFIEATESELSKLRLGDPTTDVDMGPMAQPGAPAFLEKQVSDAVAAGARLGFGGEATRIDGKGRFFEPTLLTGVTHDMDVMRSESFGPIVPIMTVASDEQALARMNDCDLGLTASVWTTDPDRAARLARQLEVGTVYMNTCDVLDPALPWTGVKDSGKGSTLSHLGFLHLTRPRSILFKLPT